MATAEDLRSQTSLLSDEAEADLALLWAQFHTATDVADGLMSALPALVAGYGDAAAVAAADWYDEHRAEQNIAGTFRAAAATAIDLGAEALAGWGASLVATETADWDAALVQISGGLQKRVATAARETITDNTFRDPQATGWQRQARATGCPFCQMLAGRGAVYRSRTTADFGAHDHCHCLALPAFSGLPVPVKPYTPTSRTITDADRARTRAWMKANL